MILEWLKRAKKHTTLTGEVSSWDSRCGKYRVEEHKSRYEKNKRKGAKRTYYAQVRVGDRWDVNDCRLKPAACPDPKVELQGWLTTAHCSEEQ